MPCLQMKTVSVSQLFTTHYKWLLFAVLAYVIRMLWPCVCQSVTTHKSGIYQNC